IFDVDVFKIIFYLKEETDDQDPLQLPNENIDDSSDDEDGDDEDQTLRKDVRSHNIKTKRNVSEMHDDMFKSCSDLQKDDFIMPKVIHINSESEFPDLNSTNVISAEKNLAKVEINNSEELKEYYTDPFSFIDVEQVFDENVGHFSIYKCCLCNFSTNDHSAVGQHNCPQIYEENPRNHTEERNSKSFHFYCLNCRFKCNSKLLYNRHLQIHPQLFPCPFCKEERLDTENWKLHVKECVKKTVGKGSNHICKFCGIIYANSGALLVHKGFHDTAKPFECLKCHYRFYTEETLNRHFKAHLLNAFKCPFCLFTNKNKTTLLTHIRCHTGEMPFSCDFCDYRSSSQSALSFPPIMPHGQKNC
ncbi:Zinc finger protein, partial [Armadillidium nasatum]